MLILHKLIFRKGAQPYAPTDRVFLASETFAPLFKGGRGDIQDLCNRREMSCLYGTYDRWKKLQTILPESSDLNGTTRSF